MIDFTRFSHDRENTVTYDYFVDVLFNADSDIEDFLMDNFDKTSYIIKRSYGCRIDIIMNNDDDFLILQTMLTMNGAKL